MLWAYTLRGIIEIIKYFLLISYSIHGRENIPDEQVIVVSNHMSATDPPMVFLSLPPRRWKLFAAKTWEKRPFFGKMLAWTGAIFIRRDQFDRRGLKEGLQAVADGYTFGLAPEGTRSKTGQMQPGRDGAAYLAVKADLPVLPVGLVHTDEWKENYHSFKRTHLEAHIGPPIHLPKLDRRVRTRDLPAYTHYIMIHIANQIPDRYHGYYADSPALAALQRGEDPWPHCLEAEGVAA